MKKKSVILLLCAAILLSGCSKADTSVSEAEETKAGDFNFINQRPNSTTSGDGYIHDPDAWQPEGSNEYRPPAVEDGSSDESSGEDLGESTSEEWDEEAAYIAWLESLIEEEASKEKIESPYKDLDSNSSLRIGTNVYASIPSAVLENTTSLEIFLETQRMARALVSESEWYTSSVLKEVFQNGNCVHVMSNNVFIMALGLEYWVRCFASSEADIASPTMSMFNLPTMTASNGSYSTSYSTLGELIQEEDDEHYHKAVYEIEDVVDNPDVQARAVLMYDKDTGSASTCVIIYEPLLYEESLDYDLLISSVRYTNVTPSNYVEIY